MTHHAGDKSFQTHAVQMLVAVFAMAFVGILFTSPCQAAPVLDSVQEADYATSLVLPPGSQLYVFGAANGGYRPCTVFTNGQTVSVLDACASTYCPGNIATELAATSINSNSYQTETYSNAICGFGASGFGYAQGFYETNPGPGNFMTVSASTTSSRSL